MGRDGQHEPVAHALPTACTHSDHSGRVIAGRHIAHQQLIDFSPAKQLAELASPLQGRAIGTPGSREGGELAVWPTIQPGG
jgi:hypothetical protein